MVVLFGSDVPVALRDSLRAPLERAARQWPGFGEALVHMAARPSGPSDVVLRVTTRDWVSCSIHPVEDVAPHQLAARFLAVLSAH